VKFKDADLIGLPLRIAIGKKGLAEGKVEWKQRGAKESSRSRSRTWSAARRRRCATAEGGSGVNRICAALDVPDLADAERLASKLAGHVGSFKVGLELFVAHGRAAVEAVRKLGAPIFLDLKLHDIRRR